jgi:hypothetical protein
MDSSSSIESNKICRVFYLALLFSMLIVASCGADSPSKKAPTWVVRCGSVSISPGEFQAFLQQQTRRNLNLQLTPERERELLERLVEKRLLLLEAEKLKLDQDPEFIQDLREMREQALMKRLLTKKGAELEKQATVTDEEIKRIYEQMGQEVRFRYLPVTEPQQAPKLLQEWSAGKCEGAVESGLVNQVRLADSWKKCLQGLQVKKPALVTMEGQPFLVELLARKEVPPPPLEKVRGEIAGELLERKKAALMQTWIRSLKGKNFLELNEDYLKR